MGRNVRYAVAIMALLALAVLPQGCASGDGSATAAQAEARDDQPKLDPKAIYVLTEADTAGLDRAIFAGGCFWCEETAYEGVEGVQAVISGYVGGEESNPTYDEVSYGRTSHTEAVLVTFDPEVVTYQRLLEIFWVNHDPTTADRQFCDRGLQYRPGIFYLSDAQKEQAVASVDWAKSKARFDEPIVTEITRAGEFWPAENYHQDFYLKNPTRYYSYRAGCRRDARLAQLWGDAAAKH